MDQQSIATLTQRIVGDVMLPSDPDYETLRRVFNRMGSPAVIVRARNNEDIVTAIRFAREQQLLVSVRSGGHASTGLAINDGGLVLDLAHFGQVALLDPARRLVRVGAGARWGAVANTLAAYELAISSGDSNQVGVGWLTLGGGIGWLARTYGLTIDSLCAAELVAADGQTLHVSAEDHPDLFWAIRGGGGNFGVVTSFDFEAVACKAVVGGSVIYEATEARTVLANWVSAMRAASDELNSTLVLSSGLGSQIPPQVTVRLCYADDDEVAAHDAIAPFLRLGAMRSVDIQKKAYAAMLENAVAPHPSLMLLNQNGFVRTLSDDALDVLASMYGQAGSLSAQIRYLGGAVARVSPEATAFAHRESEALLFVPVLAPRDASAKQLEQARRGRLAAACALELRRVQ